jgi:hypothetical protein
MFSTQFSPQQIEQQNYLHAEKSNEVNVAQSEKTRVEHKKDIVRQKLRTEETQLQGFIEARENARTIVSSARYILTTFSVHHQLAMRFRRS